MNFLSQTPTPPYYAVIFTSIKREYDIDYEKTAEHMMLLAENQPGFLGVESVRENNGNGITVSYWDSLETIRNWKIHTEHQSVKEKGKSVWYEAYAVRVTKVETQRLFQPKETKD
ncbi:antibiotic biosynthesis monooxygenase family protein [Bacillus atrophaeus]|uniref:antibiotic biosynthesis monooxygenase family protein n=1 Tax=Bacillus atrophaeus TaxID=1452 RepID=UPI001C0F5E94|nr:antibiotic biosynthesis monooxygenase [Bacillus atrophaeus]MBU5263109.1 antibiotic biosynthesis monooxygenase [Bacillus atrophaeus]